MLAGLTVAIALLTEAASASPAYGPARPAPPKPPPVKTAVDGCAPGRPNANAREIVICAQRPQGYRLDPDVLEARREFKSGGRPRPREGFRTNDCAAVGPMGCRGGPVINLVAAAITAATMATRLAKGEEIGQHVRNRPAPERISALRRGQAAARGARGRSGCGGQGEGGRGGQAKADAAKPNSAPKPAD